MAGDEVTPYAVLLGGYVGLLAAALAIDVLGRARVEPFRPLAPVLEAALAQRMTRWLIWIGWAWLGFHFLAR
jgi:Family of unknown function (DUF6186)